MYRFLLRFCLCEDVKKVVNVFSFAKLAVIIWEITSLQRASWASQWTCKGLISMCKFSQSLTLGIEAPRSCMWTLTKKLVGCCCLLQMDKSRHGTFYAWDLRQSVSHHSQIQALDITTINTSILLYAYAWGNMCRSGDMVQATLIKYKSSLRQWHERELLLILCYEGIQRYKWKGVWPSSVALLLLVGLTNTHFANH